MSNRTNSLNPITTPVEGVGVYIVDNGGILHGAESGKTWEDAVKTMGA